MLDLNLGTPGQPIADTVPARTTRHRFAYAGVAFEILAGEGVTWELPRSMDRQLSAVTDGAVVADVVCSVAVDRARAQAPASSFPSARRESAVGVRMETPEACIELLASGAQRYAATALIAPTRDAAAAMLRAIAAEVSSGRSRGWPE